MSSTYIKQETKPPVISGIWYQGEYRRSGASTRLADKYIQDLFNNGFVTIVDHYNGGKASEFLYRTVVDRIRHEHAMIKFVGNKEKLTIKIL